MREILDDIKEGNSYTDRSTYRLQNLCLRQSMDAFGYSLCGQPIDLIPDFIPVIGYREDAIILPLDIALAVKMISEEVYEESKRKAEKSTRNITTSDLQ